MPAFTPGTPKPPASGRKKGTPNKNTELLRAGIKSAIEIVHEGGQHPVEILMEASRFLRNVSVALAPKGGSAEDLQAAVTEMASTPKGMKQLVEMRHFWETASNIAYKAAEFGCAKLARIDYVGDRPSGQTIKNKMIFTLNIDSGEAPGRPVATHDVTPREYEETPEPTDGPPPPASEPDPDDVWKDDEES